MKLLLSSVSYNYIRCGTALMNSECAHIERYSRFSLRLFFLFVFFFRLQTGRVVWVFKVLHRLQTELSHWKLLSVTPSALLSQTEFFILWFLSYLKYVSCLVQNNNVGRPVRVREYGIHYPQAHVSRCTKQWVVYGKKCLKLYKYIPGKIDLECILKKL